MGHPLGIIAGSGVFPFLVIEEAKKRGLTCVVAGIKEEAAGGLKDKADEFEWVDVGEVSKLLSFFKKHGIQEALMAGKVEHRKLFQERKLDEYSSRLLTQLMGKSPTLILKTFIDFMGQKGVHIIEPTSFLAEYFCKEGVMTETIPTLEAMEDINYGMGIAKKMADLDIGQTVIVKDKAVVGVEGMEGTDEAIKRGGRLAGEGIVVAKVGRTLQDIRIDLPAVGLSTMKTLVRARGKALCIEANKVLFFQKDEAISWADSHRIIVIAQRIS